MAIASSRRPPGGGATSVPFREVRGGALAVPASPPEAKNKRLTSLQFDPALLLQYMSDRKMSYHSFHIRAISMGITKSESQTLMDAASKLKGILCVKRTGSPAALS